MKLVTFGDSWPQGAELKEHEVPYGQILSSMLGTDSYVNYGEGGSSLEHLVMQLDDYIKNHDFFDTVAVFFLTNPARSIYWPKNASWDWESSERKNWPSDALDFVKTIFLNFHDYDMFRASLSITACQKICQQYNIKDYYFSGWVKFNSWLPSVDQSRIWNQGKETAACWLEASDHNGEHLLSVENNKYFVPNFCHPNQLGHNVIAQRLHSWITQK